MSITNPSPVCTVNGSSTVNGANVTSPSTVTVALSDPSGVGPWSLVCVGTDELNTTAAINAGISINTATHTATFPAPAQGSALVFQSQVNGGLNGNGTVDPTKTTTFGVFNKSGNGCRPLAFGETLESNASFGWIADLNQMLRNALFGSTAGAGTGLTYTGSVYNVGQNADNSITVNAHDIQLKPAFSAQLTGATSAATASTLAQRDASAGCAFAAVTATTIVASAASSLLALTLTGASGAALLSSSPGQPLAIQPGNDTVVTSTGAALNVTGTAATAATGNNAGGNVVVAGGAATATSGVGTGGNVVIVGGQGTSSKWGNIALGHNAASYGGGQNVVWVDNADTVPSSTPATGVVLYASSGYLCAATSGGVNQAISWSPTTLVVTSTNTLAMTLAAAQTNHLWLNPSGVTANWTLTFAGISGSLATGFRWTVYNNTAYTCNVTPSQGSNALVIGSMKFAQIMWNAGSVWRLTPDTASYP